MFSDIAVQNWFLILDVVNQNKMFSFEIKCLAKNVFPSDVERTVMHCPLQLKWLHYATTRGEPGCIQIVSISIDVHMIHSCPHDILN